MGGNLYRWDARPTVESRAALDVRLLARTGRLPPGQEPIVTLSYDTDGTRVDENVALDYTPCNYGGMRPWWRCPGCGTRVAILYSGLGFRCRRCHGLAYTTTREDADCRAILRARRLVERLGGTPMIGPGPRPRGAHRDRWERKVLRWLVADEEAMRALGRRWKAVGERLSGAAERPVHGHPRGTDD
jgi:hypothetical protein